jgi:hypothetical protein
VTTVTRTKPNDRPDWEPREPVVTIHSFFPSKIILEPKLFALKNQKLTAFFIFESKMAARSAFLCQPVGFVPQKYG